MKKIAVLLSNRASYERHTVFLKKLKNEFDVTILGCSSLLKEEYSNVFNEINTNYTTICLDVDVDTNSCNGMANYSANLSVVTLDQINFKQYSGLILIADRFELLPVAMDASYCGCLIVHIQAGEDSGNIDQKVRHAVTMLSDICFVSHHVAYNRVKNMGIKEVYNYGCPSIDVVKDVTIVAHNATAEKYIISMFHPHTKESISAGDQFVELVDAVTRFSTDNSLKVYWMAPNNDPGYKYILDKINKDMIINMHGKDFIRLLAGAKMIVGNSSAGIRESSYLGIPAVNIGKRQENRITGNNVVHCENICSQNIYNSMLFAYGLKPDQSTLFGSGNASDKIIAKLKEVL